MVKANKKILLGLLTVGVISNLQSNERRPYSFFLGVGFGRF